MIFLLFIISLIFFIQLKDQKKELINVNAVVINVTKTKYNDLITVKVGTNNYNFYSNKQLLVGHKLLISATKKNYSKETIPNAFNSYKYYKGNNIQGYLESVTVIKKNSVNYRYYINQTKEKLVKNIDPTVKPFVVSFIYRENKLDESITKDLKLLNVMHLVSLSGLHIVVLLSFIKKGMFYFDIEVKTQHIIELVIITLLFIVSDFNLTLLRILIYYSLKHIKKSNNLQITNFSLIQVTFLCIIIIRPYTILSQSLLIMYLLVNTITLLSPLYSNKSYYGKTIIISLIASLVLLPFTNQLNLMTIIIMPFFILLIVYFIYPLSIIILLINKVSIFVKPIYQLLPLLFNYLSSKENFLKINIPKMQPLFIVIYFSLIVTFFISYKLIKKIIIFLLIISLIIYPLAKRKLKPYSMYFLNVGQGDSFVYIDANLVIVIDSYRYVGSFLENLGINTIDYLILSHSHSDHSAEAESLIENFQVKNVILSKYDTYDLNYGKLKKVSSGYQIKEKNLLIDFIGPLRDYGNANDNSLVFKFVVNNYSILFTGDIEKAAEEDLIKAYGKSLAADLIKVAHHGSITSSSEKFIKLVNPKDAIISLGINNKHNFPHQNVLKRFEINNTNIYRTDEDWTIIIYKERIYKYRFITLKNKLLIV